MTTPVPMPANLRVRGHALVRITKMIGDPPTPWFKVWACRCGLEYPGGVNVERRRELHAEHVRAMRAQRPLRREPEAMKARPGATLLEAKQWLRERLGDGATCPCCTQLAKAYRRPLHASMAAKLLRFYRAFGTEWGSRVEFTGGEAEGDFAKLRYWHLVEESKERRSDGGRAGWWRVTERGARFCAGELRLPRYVFVYDGRAVHLPGGTTFEGELVDIHQALGKAFRWNELMGVPL